MNIPGEHRQSRAVGAFAVSGVAAAIAMMSGSAMASSHREAPFIATQPSVDATDFYMFRSYEPGWQDHITVLANYLPFQDPQGGPNFYQFDPDALYEIHIDNNGDAREDLTFQFRFKSESKGTALPVGDKQVGIPLINAGVVAGVNPATLNVRETFTVDVLRGGRRGGERSSLTNVAGGGKVFDKPVDNIGDKSFGGATGYEGYAEQHIYTVAIPGCDKHARLFAGQRSATVASARSACSRIRPAGRRTTPRAARTRSTSRSVSARRTSRWAALPQASASDGHVRLARRPWRGARHRRHDDAHLVRVRRAVPVRADAPP